VIEATRVAAMAQALTYRFVVGPSETAVVTGRASVLLLADDA
jgi:hypothetical protein